MIVAGEIPFNQSKSTVRNDGLILLSYVVFAVVAMVLIYASASPGSDAAEIASMSVFP